jgi:isopenicillin-N N-acyltransferase-like protein
VASPATASIPPGVALTANFLACDRDFKSVGVPLGILRRKILEQKNLAGAIKVLGANDRSCSNNIMLSQADGEAIDLECVPDETFWIQPEEGLLPHSNHFISPVARAKITDTYYPKNPDTLYRWSRVRDYLLPRAARSTTRTWSRRSRTATAFPTACCARPSPRCSTRSRPPSA